MENLIEITEAEFEKEVLNSAIPVVVDFWASWCMPCKAFMPVLADVAADYVGRVKFVKVNVDDCEAIARQYGVMSIPTLKVIKGGEVVAEAAGMRPRKAVADMIDGIL